MKAYVITIRDNERSVEVAERCIASCKRNGLEVEMWDAITPRHREFKELVLKYGLKRKNFDKGWSRPENAMAVFLSMTLLWEHSVKIDRPVLILEHDALMMAPLPNNLNFGWVCTLGRPSYGKYNTPSTLGVGPLVQKPYFGGAHSYVVSPEGARRLLENIAEHNQPADVYLNSQLFPFLQEYYPWLFRVNDSFSTIQHDAGCRAKHNYERGFELVEP